MDDKWIHHSNPHKSREKKCNIDMKNRWSACVSVRGLPLEWPQFRASYLRNTRPCWTPKRRHVRTRACFLSKRRPSPLLFTSSKTKKNKRKKILVASCRIKKKNGPCMFSIEIIVTKFLLGSSNGSLITYVESMSVLCWKSRLKKNLIDTKLLGFFFERQLRASWKVVISTKSRSRKWQL